MTDATFERDVLADAAIHYANTWRVGRDYQLLTPRGLVNEDRQAELSDKIERARKALDAAAVAYADAVRTANTAAEDSPEFDGTNLAHPAWWRGHTYAMQGACRAINNILDGDGPKDAAFVEGDNWSDLRKRLAALVCQPEEPESSAVTAMRVTLYGIECYLPSSIAEQVQEACADTLFDEKKAALDAAVAARDACASARVAAKDAQDRYIHEGGTKDEMMTALAALATAERTMDKAFSDAAAIFFANKEP